jgi:ABC-type glycerol-3-phosphate transport system substrate-binding protein
MPDQDLSQTNVSSDAEKISSSASQVNSPKAKKGLSSFSFLNFLKPKSATMIPKAASKKIPKPSLKSSTSPIRPPRKGGGSQKKILILVIAILFVIVLGLLFVVVLKKGPKEDVGERGKLTWWGQRDKTIVQPLIDKFEEENPGVTIDYQKQDPIDYRVRLENLIDKGNAPDIFSIHNTWAPMFTGNLDILPSNVMEKKEYSNIFYPAIVSSLETSQGIVGIPIGYDALVLYINQDLFSTAFASPPETWDDFKQLAKFLTDAPDGRIIQAGAAMGITSNVNHWEEILALLMVQNGVSLSKPTGERAEEVFKYYTSFTGKGSYVWDETLPESVLAFANKKLAMLLAPTYRSNEIRRINSDLRFITVAVPQVPQADPSSPDVTYATFWFEGVWNRSVNSDIAWDLLKFLVDRDNQVEISQNYRSQGLFPEVFPRRDMKVLLKDDPILGPVVNLADYSASWYIAGDTQDGEDGINSRLSEAFKSGIQESHSSKRDVTAKVSERVQMILSKYGLAPRVQLPR